MNKLDLNSRFVPSENFVETPRENQNCVRKKSISPHTTLYRRCSYEQII